MYNSDNKLYLTNGTQAATALALQIQNYNVINSGVEGWKPAVILVTPFFGGNRRTIKASGFPVIPCQMEMDGPYYRYSENLRQIYKECHKAKIAPIAIVDANPSNPTGLARCPEDMKTTARIVKNVYSRAMNGKLPYFTVMIDDIVYRDTTYNDEFKTPSFASSIIAHLTFIVGSLSKIGLPGLRAGYCYVPFMGGSSEAGEIHDALHTTQNLVGTEALALYYDRNSPLRDEIADFKQSFLSAYQLHGRLLRAMLHGRNDADLTQTQFNEAAAVIGLHTGLTPHALGPWLEQGAPGWSLATKPVAGFFQVLDGSALYNPAIQDHANQFHWWNGTPSHESKLWNYLDREFGIQLGSGEYMGMNGDECRFRLTMGVPTEELVSLGLRLAQSAQYITGQMPTEIKAERALRPSILPSPLSLSPRAA